MRTAPIFLAAVFASACFTPTEDTIVGTFDAGVVATDGGNTGGGGGNTGGGGGNTGGGNTGGGNTGGGNTGGGNTGGGNTGGGNTGGQTPLTCRPGTWCWQHPLPQGQGLNSVAAVSATEAWAVGERGAMLRLQNGTWTAMTPVTDFSLSDLTASGPNDVWAIGTRGQGTASDPYASQVLHFDGTRWAVIPHGAQPMVSEVVSAPSGETWVLTAAMTTTIPSMLLRWDGAALVPAAALPAGLDPKSVCVRSANEVWMTASDALNSFPVGLYKWNGTFWSTVQTLPPGSSRRFDSQVACPADGVAVVQVFEFNTARYSFLEVRNGTVTFLPTPQYGKLVRTPRGEVFSVSGLSASQWTPTGLQPRFMLDASDSVFSVNFDFFGTSGWMVKHTPAISTWDGSTFVTPRVEGVLRAFVSAPALNPTDPIAAFGDGTWARRTGTTWQFATTPLLSTGNPLRVNQAFDIQGGAWLVGNALARYDANAQTITTVLVPASGELVAIDGSDANTLWAVGDALVLRYDGTQWAPPAVPPPALVNGMTFNNREFVGVHVRSANDVMLFATDIAGGAFASIFYRWDGTSWSASSSFGTTLQFIGRDTAGNVYSMDAQTVQKRAPGATTWTPLGTVNGFLSRGQVYGVDEVELVLSSGQDVGLYTWDSDRQTFSLKSVLGFAGATDLVRGGSTPAGGATFWSLGSFGSVLRYEP